MHHADKRKVFLNPGEFLFGEQGTHIHTLLGSCIAITLWHPDLQIGGMCHFVLPERTSADPETSIPPCGRYGDEAMELFERAAELHGTHLSDYHGKIFGGADMFGTNSEEELVGCKNAEKAMNMLRLRNVDIQVAHVGESGSRRVVLDVSSGDVWVKHMAEDGHRFNSTSGIN